MTQAPDDIAMVPADFQGTYAEYVAAYDAGDLTPNNILTDEDIVRLLSGDHSPLGLTAAGDSEHTGAMIALLPSQADMDRLYVLGGEEDEELHLTLCYLGEAAKIGPSMKDFIVENAARYAREQPIVDAEAFGVATFNEKDGKKDTCIVLLISGEELARAKSRSETDITYPMIYAGLPEQHEPWIPHVTLAYTNDAAIAGTLSDREGPIRFDRVRVAFGGEVTDFPLYDGTANSITASFKEVLHPRDGDGQFTEKGGGITSALKKAVPAIIYKKHSHDTVVAQSGSRRLRWDDDSKKFIHEEKSGDGWSEKERLTKGQAYDSLKTDDWSHVDTSVPKSESKPVMPKVPNVPKPTVAPSADTQKQINDVRTQLDQIAKDAEPWRKIAADITHKAGIGKVLTKQDLQDADNADAELKKLSDKGRKLAAHELQLRIDADGSPWGDNDTEASHWANIGKPSTVNTSSFNGAKFEKQRDQYVVNDKMTVMNNESLRTNEPTSAAKAWRGRMNSIIKMQQLNDDAIVWRGAAMKPSTIMKLKPGLVMRDAGTMSTDVDQSGAEFYMNTRLEGLPDTLPVLFKVRARKGTNVADVDYGEFVFAPGSALSIVSLNRDDNGVINVVAEVVE